ncbi:unnamed protein product, partial [Meganyctiphanes norvegica]
MSGFLSGSSLQDRKTFLEQKLAVPAIHVLGISLVCVHERLSLWDIRWPEGPAKWHFKNNRALLRPPRSSKSLPTVTRRMFRWLRIKTDNKNRFYDNGHTVVGIEGITKPVLEFFSEQQLEYNIQELPWAKIYQTSDERLKIYVCDLFNIDAKQMGQFDAVWDRGSLVAIYEEDRKKYSTLMKSLLGSDFRYLVAVMHYTPHEGFSGPPRNVPNETVQQLFGDVSNLEVLEIIDMSSDERVKGSWGLDKMNEFVLLLTPKS